MALGSPQPLTEMRTRNISWGVKAVGAWGWQPYHLQAPIVLKSGNLNHPETSRPVQACDGIAITFTTTQPVGSYQMIFREFLDKIIFCDGKYSVYKPIGTH